MNSYLPIPERAMPRQSASRVRAAIMGDGLDAPDRRYRSWLLPLAAALVVIALVVTAVVLWPR